MDSISRFFRDMVKKVRGFWSGEKVLHGNAGMPRAKSMLGITALVVACVIVAAGLISTSNLAGPGTALYAIKTNVAEEWGSMLRLSAESKGAYRVRLLARREREAQQLADMPDPSDKALMRLLSATQSDIRDLRQIVETGGGIPLTASLTFMADAATELRMMEEITHTNDQLSLIEEQIEDLQGDTETTRDNLILLFVTSSPEDEMRTYITRKLSELSNQLDEDGNEWDADVLAGVSKQAERMATAVAADNAAKALEALYNARQLIDVGARLELN